MNGIDYKTIDYNKTKADINNRYGYQTNHRLVDPSAYGMLNQYSASFDSNNMPLAPSLQISHQSQHQASNDDKSMTDIL